MTVEQCIITKTGSTHAITSRVSLSCELVETVDGESSKVRLLEAGAGLAIDDEIVVPNAKLTG